MGRKDKEGDGTGGIHADGERRSEREEPSAPGSPEPSHSSDPSPGCAREEELRSRIEGDCRRLMRMLDELVAIEGLTQMSHMNSSEEGGRKRKRRGKREGMKRRGSPRWCYCCTEGQGPGEPQGSR